MNPAPPRGGPLRVAVVGEGGRAAAAYRALERGLPGAVVEVHGRVEGRELEAVDVVVTAGAAAARRVLRHVPELPMVVWADGERKREKALPASAVRHEGAAEGLAGAVLGALADAVRELRHRLDQLPVGVYRTTAGGRLVSASRTALKLLGFRGWGEARGADVAGLYADPAYRGRILERLDREGVVRGSEIRIRRPDGSEVWLRDSVRAVRDGSGEIAALEGTLEEVTGERRLRRRIERAKRMWEATFDVVPDLIVLTDGSGLIERLNLAMAKALGGHPRDLVGTPLPDPWLRAARSAAEGIRVAGPEEGLPGHFLVSVGELTGFGEDGPLVLAVYRDIDEVRRLERDLARSEARFRALAEANLAGVYLLRGDRFLYVNPALARIVGREPAEIVKRLRVDDLVWPEDRPLVRENLRRRYAGEVDELHYRFRALHRDGRPVPVEVLGRRLELDGETVVLGTILDVSARVAAEEALRERTRELETLLANLPGMAYRRANHRDWPMAFASEGARELTGHEPAGLTGEDGIPYARLIHPDDRERVWRQVQEALAEGRPHRIQYRLVRRDGTVRWVWEQGRGVRTEDGTLVHLEGIVLDVTDRVVAEERSRAAYRRLETLVEQLPEGVLLLEGGRLLLANAAAVRLLERLGHPLDAGVPVTSVAGVPLVELGPEPVEVERDGVVCTLASRPVRGGARGERLVMVRDITREREAQRRLARQDRLAAVGRLAAGIAHDFNNLLQSVMTSAELLLMVSGEREDVRRHAETIRGQAERGGRLVRQILDFSRRSLRRPEPLDLAELVDETVSLLRSSVRENVRIETRVEAGPHWVVGDPVQLQQALTNLVLNAAAAMPDGGLLRVELQRVEVPEGGPEPAEGVGPGVWVTLAVADTGVGIPREIRDRIFEPFFTTRPGGGGTGLGLAQVWGIVRQHGGVIHVVSEVGVGSIFTVYLPARTGAPRRPPAGGGESRRPGTESAGRGELVLLVEDEAAVRESTAAGLRWHGFGVVTARDGIAALETFERLRDEVAAVVTDAVMPRLGGPALARRLRAAGFSGPIAVLSGYPESDAGGSPSGGPVDRWLTKPLGAGELARELRALLDG